MAHTKADLPLIIGTNELGLSHWVGGGWPLVMLLCACFVFDGCYTRYHNFFGADSELSRPGGRHEAMPHTKADLPLIIGAPMSLA